MKFAVLCLCGLVGFTLAVDAQQVSPRPVVEQEVRDNGSIRMRELQLERVKSDFRKSGGKRNSNLANANLADFKEDFEGLQKLQDRIVRIYTTGRTIAYRRIADLAGELSKKAFRLEANLFGDEPEKEPVATKEYGERDIRDLIVDLDNAIGDFVRSPYFSNDKLVDRENSEKTHSDLRRVVLLSKTLTREAKKF